MGHTRLGNLPKTQKWQDLVAQIAGSRVSGGVLSAASYVEDIAAQVGSEHGEQLGARHLAVAHDLNGGRGGNAEAGIVTEKVTYQDRQKEQAADHDDGSNCR